MRIVRRLIAPLLALALFGPGHGALAAGHGAMSTCAMFTAADASAVLGGTAKETTSQKLGLFTSCDYATPRPYRLIITLATTTAAIQKQHKGATAASLFAQTRKSARVKQSTVKHLGDGAFYIAGLGELWVLKSDVVFNITGVSGGAQIGESELIKAAKLILKHLEPVKRTTASRKRG
jgi:hypothetical protein